MRDGEVDGGAVPGSGSDGAPRSMDARAVLHSAGALVRVWHGGSAINDLSPGEARELGVRLIEEAARAGDLVRGVEYMVGEMGLVIGDARERVVSWRQFVERERGR